jgi:hypothetical protein
MGRSEELDDETTDDVDTEEQETESDGSEEESFYDGDVPSNLDKSYKEMQRAFTRKTTELAEERKRIEMEVEQLRQRATMYDQLAADPEQAIEMLSRLTGKSSKSRIDSQDEDDDFSDYGENAESMKRLVKSITNKVTKSLTREISPLLQNSQEAAFEKEMQNLSSWVETQRKKTGLELPDPSVLEPSIRDRMNRKGDTILEAYKASLNLDKLPTRKPVIEGKKKQSTFQPGGSSSARSKSTGMSTDDAIERRKQGKRGGFSIEELTKMYEEGKTS